MYNCTKLDKPGINTQQAVQSTDWSRWPKEVDEPPLSQMPQETYICRNDKGHISKQAKSIMALRNLDMWPKGQQAMEITATQMSENVWISIEPAKNQVTIQSNSKGTKPIPIKDYWMHHPEFGKNGRWIIGIIELQSDEKVSINRMVGDKNIAVLTPTSFAECEPGPVPVQAPPPSPRSQ